MRLGANRISVLHRNKLGGELAVIERKLKLYYKNQAEEEERNAVDELKSNPRFFLLVCKEETENAYWYWIVKKG